MFSIWLLLQRGCSLFDVIMVCKCIAVLGCFLRGMFQFTWIYHERFVVFIFDTLTWHCLNIDCSLPAPPLHIPILVESNTQVT